MADALAERDGRPVDLEDRLAAGLGLVVSKAVRAQWHAGGGEAGAVSFVEEVFGTVRALAGGTSRRDDQTISRPIGPECHAPDGPARPTAHAGRRRNVHRAGEPQA